MKTILEVNANNYASTGKIALNITRKAIQRGYDAKLALANTRAGKKHDNKEQFFIGFWLDRVMSEKLCTYTGLIGHFNIINTLIFINKLNELKPDLIHLHSIVDSYLNIDMLVNYINKKHIPVVYTFHDAWAFTGKCCFFDAVNCYKWKDECKNCPVVRNHPVAYLDQTNKLHKEKKKLFNSIENLTIVTCSSWLADLTRQSYLKNKNIMVINNGINLDIYHYLDNNIKEKLNIENKYMILGIANLWDYRKGLDEFIKLSKDLDDNYQIVLVGTNDEVDKQLPKNIISIHRTFNQEELVMYYSAADLFVIPTREDNFPTVNMEALACGTPVLTYKTGGSPEIIDETCGSVVEKNDYDSLKNEIIRICETKPYSKEACIKRAQIFDMNDKFDEYVDLFDEILAKI